MSGKNIKNISYEKYYAFTFDVLQQFYLFVWIYKIQIVISFIK